MSPSDTIDAVVLAGGLGTRLRGLVRDVPKPLAPVGGRPFLDLVLRNAGRMPGIGRVVLAVSHMADQVVRRYAGRTDFGFEIDFSVEPAPLGTGGAIRRALEKTTSPTVLAVNGDSFAEVDWRAFRAFHSAGGDAMTVLLKEVGDAGRYGRVAVDPAGRVLSFEEKRTGAGTGLVNAGVYLFDRRLFDDVPAGVPCSLERDLIPRFLGRGIRGFVTRGKFIDIGVPESYLAAGDYLAEAQGGEKK